MAEYEIKYRFPASLCGGLYKEYRHVSGGTEAPIGTVAFLIDNALVCVARTLLTEEQDLEELSDGGVVLDRDGAAWQRSGDWWSCVTQDDPKRWNDLDWNELKESLGPLTPLAPATDQTTSNTTCISCVTVAQEGDEELLLPWGTTCDPHTSTSVDCYSVASDTNIIIDTNRSRHHSVLVQLTPDQAEYKARALRAAALKARQAEYKARALRAAATQAKF